MAKESLKIQPIRVPADNCVVFVGRRMQGTEIVDFGEPVKPHEGEWVDILPIQSMKEVSMLTDLMAAGESNKGVMTPKQLLALQPKMDMLINEVADRVVDWNLTDWKGNPLPKPNRDVIAGLTEDELLWLMSCAQWETPIERKKD